MRVVEQNIGLKKSERMKRICVIKKHIVISLPYWYRMCQRPDVMVSDVTIITEP